MNILLLASHAVAEYDDIRMFNDLGYDVFCPGGYENPAQSGEGIRPPLPDVPYHEDLQRACNEQRARLHERLGAPGPFIDWAKAQLHPDVLDWADVIIAHHFVDRWLVGQWDQLRGKRVIWRTCGQSNPELERTMAGLDGLQIVRYSPAERRYFEPRGSWAGEDALIRFGKYPDDYGPWTGDLVAVGNITQDMAKRGDACGLTYWQRATRDLSVAPAGPGSEDIRGLGKLTYEGMLDYLRRVRVYLYTGTTPASYTLGLIEAMMSGVPVVSIGAKAWGDGWGGADLFEAATSDTRLMPGIVALDQTADDPSDANWLLRTLLKYPEKAAVISDNQRRRAIDLFGIETVGAQWRAFLS